MDQLLEALETAEVTGWELLAAVVVLIAALPIGKLVYKLVVRTLRRVPNVPEVMVADVGRGARWLVYLVALAISLSLLGLGVGWFAIASVFAIVVGVLVLKPQIENSAAGWVLIMRPAFGVGDQIEVAGDRGIVLEIGSHSTVIRTNDGLRIHTPNSEMLSQTVKVYTAFDSRRAQFDLTLDDSVDVDHAVTIITAALVAADVVVADPAPDVVASAFDSNAVTVTARVWGPSSMTSDAAVIDAAIRSVNSAIADAGIGLDTLDITITEASTKVPEKNPLQPTETAGS